MKNSGGRLIIICVALLAFASVPLLSKARTVSTATSVNIVNNSNRVLCSVYLSHADRDDWTGNQLSEGATIGPGQSSTLSNVACDQQQVKVISEDQDGCFLSTVVSCGESSTWTITNSTAADCN